MSLDVYLTEPNVCPHCGKAITEAGTEVFSANITHNLNTMAEAAGIYKHLWRPEDVPATQAGDLIKPLTDGLSTMKADPKTFRAFDAPNGWGTYDQFVPWVENYLQACREHPDAAIRVLR